MTLAQEIIQTCINRPELQTEIYCQLIKQTSKYRSLPLAEGAVSASIIQDVNRNISFSSGWDNMSFFRSDIFCKPAILYSKYLQQWLCYFLANS